jgi:hypothetical protein
MPDDASYTQPLAPGCWRSTALVTAVVSGAYLLLLNPYWTPGGDSEMFVSAARSIARGEGYIYNGKPVYVAPPAWPYLMAAAMWVSPTFLMLKAVSLVLMVAAWTMSHRVMLRFAPVRWATWSAILGALVVPVYSLTFWLHSEPLFCALSWGAALLAVRAAEDRRRTLEIFGVIVLCALMAGVRWTSGIQWGVVAAVLAGGWHRGRGDGRAVGTLDQRITIGLGLSALATVLVFLLLFFLLPRVAQAVTPALDMQDIPPTVQDAEDAPPDLVDNTIFKNLSPWEERITRLLASGHWISWTLWYPLRFAGGVSQLAWVSLLAGWLVIGLLALSAWRSVRRRGAISDWPLGRWVWPALLGYLFLLVLIWPLPNARYLVPVAPLVILGVLWGCASLAAMANRPKIAAALTRTFVISLLIVNGLMYAIDVRHQRSGDRLLGGSGKQYYARYEAGLHLSLLRAIDYLKDRGVADHELAVSERYFNLNRMRFSKAGPRNVVMLMDREVVSPPIYYSFVPGEIPEKLYIAGNVLPGGFSQWGARHGVKYYLYQQPSEPWRLWHFRIAPELQERLTGKPLAQPTFGWLLFTADDGFGQPVALPDDFEAPTRIPGL